MKFEDVFARAEPVSARTPRESAVEGALNMLAASGETFVEVHNLLNLSPKTWSEKCRGRGWSWTQRRVEDRSTEHLTVTTHYYIEVK